VSVKKFTGKDFLFDVSFMARIHSGKFSADRNDTEQILLLSERNRCLRERKIQAKQGIRSVPFLFAENFPK